MTWSRSAFLKATLAGILSVLSTTSDTSSGTGSILLKNIRKTTYVVQRSSHVAISIIETIGCRRRRCSSSVLKVAIREIESPRTLPRWILLPTRTTSLHQIWLDVLNILLGNYHLLLVVAWGSEVVNWVTHLTETASSGPKTPIDRWMLSVAHRLLSSVVLWLVLRH